MRWVVASLVVLVGCGGHKSDAKNDADISRVDSPTAPVTAWEQIGPAGGFVPEIAFQPGSAGVVWASGDDACGLYKSTDGGTSWAEVATGVQNESTYSLRVDPTNAMNIYAPNHFGRGMLRSTDGGATWIAAQAGLPDTGSDTQEINDLLIWPAHPDHLFAATPGGLYVSTDSGATFALASNKPPGATDIRSLAYRPSDNVLFLGTINGDFDYSGDGVTWTEGFAGSGSPLVKLVFSTTSLYFGYQNGTIERDDDELTQPSLTMLNDAAAAGAAFENVNRLSLVVTSGASAAGDTVYVGTMGNATISSTQWGLFKSTNGGSSWTQSMDGMTGNAIMSIAVDPASSSNVVIGSGSGLGICRSTDAAASWTCTATGIYATTSLGMAQSSSMPSHLLASTTADGGFSRDYESMDGGATWTGFFDPPPIVDNGISAFDIDPTADSHILAGTFSLGIMATTTGTSGTWSKVADTGGNRVDRFVRDIASPTIVYAVAPPSLLVSTTSGTSFAPVTQTAVSVAAHPTHAGEAIAVTTDDAYATTDSFTSSQSLGLGGSATAEGGLLAVAFDPANPSTVLVAGALGGLYLTTTYAPNGAGTTWTKLSSPVVAAGIRDVVIADRGGGRVFYVATSKGDTGVLPTSTQGVFRSLDGGQTWTAISASMFPGSNVWRLVPEATAPTTRLLAGMWAGGLFELTDTTVP
jgi:hypothetical protein